MLNYTHVHTRRNSKPLGFSAKVVVVGSVYKMRQSCWKDLFTQFTIFFITAHIKNSHRVS